MKQEFWLKEVVIDKEGNKYVLKNKLHDRYIVQSFSLIGKFKVIKWGKIKSLKIIYKDNKNRLYCLANGIITRKRVEIK